MNASVGVARTREQIANSRTRRSANWTATRRLPIKLRPRRCDVASRRQRRPSFWRAEVSLLASRRPRRFWSVLSQHDPDRRHVVGSVCLGSVRRRRGQGSFGAATVGATCLSYAGGDGGSPPSPLAPHPARRDPQLPPASLSPRRSCHRTSVRSQCGSMTTLVLDSASAMATRVGARNSAPDQRP